MFLSPLQCTGLAATRRDFWNSGAQTLRRERPVLGEILLAPRLLSRLDTILIMSYCSYLEFWINNWPIALKNKFFFETFSSHDSNPSPTHTAYCIVWFVLSSDVPGTEAGPPVINCKLTRGAGSQINKISEKTLRILNAKFCSNNNFKICMAQPAIWWVAHKILVSAPVPLELIGPLDWVGLGWG